MLAEIRPVSARTFRAAPQLGRHMYPPAVEGGLLRVVDLVVGGDVLGGHVFSKVEQRVEGFLGMGGTAGALCQGLDIELLVEQQFEIPT